MRRLNVKRTDFEQWLINARDEEGTWLAGSPAFCPLAQYLNDTLAVDEGEEYRVVGDFVNYWPNDRATEPTRISLPVWARRFVHLVDMGSSNHVTPRRALEALDRCP